MIDRLVTFGEGLAVLRGPELQRASTLAIGTGGAESNVAMAAARSGAPVTWLGRVGDDAFGRRVVRELRGEGVTVMPIPDPSPTGMLVKELHPGGHTSVTYYRRDSAGSHLAPADLEALPLTPTTLLHVTGVTPALSPSARAATLSAVDRAVAAGATVSLDANYRSRLWSTDDAVAFYRQVLGRADVVFTGLDELRLLVPDWRGENATDAARALAAAGQSHVVVTAGERGAVALIDGELSSVDAVPVDAVDTVGAGDAFVGGYLAALIAGISIDERLRRGALLGAAACRHPGDWEGAGDLTGLLDDGEDPVRR